MTQRPQFEDTVITAKYLFCMLIVNNANFICSCVLWASIYPIIIKWLMFHWIVLCTLALNIFNSLLESSSKDDEESQVAHLPTWYKFTRLAVLCLLYVHIVS